MDKVLRIMLLTGTPIDEITKTLNKDLDEVERYALKLGAKLNTWSDKTCDICYHNYNFNIRKNTPTQTPCCLKFMCVGCALTCCHNLKMICPYCRKNLEIDQRLYNMWTS